MKNNSVTVKKQGSKNSKANLTKTKTFVDKQLNSTKSQVSKSKNATTKKTATRSKDDVTGRMLIKLMMEDQSAKIQTKVVRIKDFYKEMPTKAKKRLMAGAAVVMCLATTFAFTGLVQNDNQDNLTATIAASPRAAVYRLFADGVEIGLIPEPFVGENLLSKAKKQMIEAIGYDPEVVINLRVDTAYQASAEYESEEDIVAKLLDHLYEVAGDLKVHAYVMKINDFTVAFDSKEACIAALEAAQELYVKDDEAISVELISDPLNPMVLTPKINILQKELPEERIFVTSSGEGAPMEDLEAADDKFLEAVVKEVELEQDVLVTEGFVNSDEIVDATTAAEMITKQNEKPKTYTVVSGDTPSGIAVQNGMSTSDLYSLNPGLEENERRMQIGDELTVMVPEPELFVKTVEDVIYTEIIDRDKIYVDDPDTYIGTFTPIIEGSDGVIEIRSTITKLNGQIMDEVVHEQTVVLEPVTAKLKRGIKQLPITNATGRFEMPLLSYTFTSGFGPRWGRNHNGIDLAAPVGTKIKASDGGRVIMAGWDGGHGYSVEIDHGNGYITKYSHCSKIYVSVGQDVAQYETIAAVGNTGNSTGPHCHFEIRKNGSVINPMNLLK